MFILISLACKAQSFQTPNQPYNLSFSFRSVDGKNIVSSRDNQIITNSRAFCYGINDNHPTLWLESGMPTGTNSTGMFVYRKNGGTMQSYPANALVGTPISHVPYIMFNQSTQQLAGLLFDGEYVEIQLQIPNSDAGWCYSNILVISKENAVTTPTISAPAYTICSDKTLQFSSNKPSNTTNSNPNLLYSDNWATSNIANGTINNSGLLTAIAVTPIPTTFKATDFVTRISNYSVQLFNGTTVAFSGTCNSNVANSQVITINSIPTVEPILPLTNPMAICYTAPNNTVQLSCSTSGGTWSSNSSSATVSNDGLVAGVSAGNATISYTITNSSGCSKVVTKNISIIPCGCDETCSWVLNGNSTVTSSNYIGTKNGADFVVKTGTVGTNFQDRIIVKGNAPAGQTTIQLKDLPQTTVALPNIVIGADGTLYKTASTSLRMANNSTLPTQSEIDILKTEVEDLKAQVKALLEAKNYSTPCKVETPQGNTLNIVPTPFANNAKANYSLQNFTGQAQLQVVDINGKILKTYSIKQAQGQIEIGNLQQATGSTVIFNIVSNGELLVSKKSIKLAE